MVEVKFREFEKLFQGLDLEVNQIEERDAVEDKESELKDEKIEKSFQHYQTVFNQIMN